MKKRILILTFFIFTISIVRAEVISSLDYSGGYSDNLFQNASNYSDYYHSIGGGLKLYPSNSLELSAQGYYTHYMEMTDLSGLYSNISAIAIHDPYLSNLSLLAGVNLSVQKYGEIFSIYDSFKSNGNVNGFYTVSDKLTVSGGTYFTYLEYLNEESVTNNQFGIYGGFNLTLPGYNTIDFETVLYRKTFNNLLDNQNNEISSEFDFVDYQITLAHSISYSTGINFTVLKRILNDKNNFRVPGYTIDFLSPWSTLWDGYSLSSSLKHYFKNQFVIELYGSYSETEYVTVVDRTLTVTDVAIYNRMDENYYGELSLSKNYYFNKSMITPEIEISYSSNNSNLSLYDYSKFKLSLSVYYSF